MGKLSVTNEKENGYFRRYMSTGRYFMSQNKFPLCLVKTLIDHTSGEENAKEEHGIKIIMKHEVFSSFFTVLNPLTYLSSLVL